jgi:acetylornithine deacetylase/succinyl-diaminopimelate desuccinylase-like protein
VAVLLLGAVGCSSDDGGSDGAESGTDDSVATAGGTAADAGPEPYEVLVEALASDDLEGRDNETPGSVAAQDLIIEQVSEFADSLGDGGTGDDAYRHQVEQGTNVLAVIPGTGDLAEEYVVVGAHYDHIGTDCDSADPADTICNGATDNATGVAAAVEVGRTLAGGDEDSRRSVVLAFWDGEEDAFYGSTDYVENPPVPLESTVAYVNFDIQGSNLLPSLTNGTIMVGAETGGPNLVAAAEAAADDSALDTVLLSLLFGQGRSDHAVFAEADVPVVFLTDATGPCYHTAQDEVSVVDFAKLGEQIATAEALTLDLATTGDLPEFDADTPAASYEDAVSMQEVLEGAVPDFNRFAAEERAAAEQFVEDLGAIVDAGPDAFDEAASSTLLGGSVSFVTALASGECASFVD